MEKERASKEVVYIQSQSPPPSKERKPTPPRGRRPRKGFGVIGLYAECERKQSVEGFIDAIKMGLAFILSNSHISFPTSNGLCINAMLVERDHEVQDDDEAWVYVTAEVSAIAQPLSQQIHSWYLLHESPIGTSDLSGKAHSRIVRMIDNQCQIQPHHGPLLAAIEAADLELINQLLAAGEDIHQTDDRGWTPLHLAVSKEQASVVDALIQRQAAVNAQDRRGRTPLNIAAEGGHAQLVETLLAQGADPNIHPFDELSSLNQAIMKRHHHIVKLLLGNGAEATNKDRFGFAPLFIASGDTVSALLLLDHGVDPNLDLVRGSRLLHIAACGGNEGLVQYLLENGAEVDIREGYGDRGNTALYRAVEEQQEETVQILLEHKADPNLVVENSWTCVLLAASIGNYAILQLLLRHGPRRVSHFCLPERWTALHIASKNGHRLPAKALLEAGWDYTTEDASGSTPAQLALEAGHQSTAQAITDFHLRQLNAGSRVDSP
jgi:ankyrin repeat protein